MDKMDKMKNGQMILMALDGKMTDEQFAEFDLRLREDAEFRQYYLQFMHINASLNAIDKFPSYRNDESSGILDYEIWEQFSRMEHTAPAIETVEIEKPEPEPAPARQVERGKRPYPKRKTHFLVTILSTAALIAIVLYLEFSPTASRHIPVATLVDQINAHWAQSQISLKKGDRLWPRKGMLELQKGIVKIRYDEGVDVIIEGPAAFEIERARILLDFGRLYSKVSDSGLGFTVITPTSRFIDHGTEFGVHADVNGSSELHVIKGKVQLFAGSQNKSKVGQLLTEGNAARYDEVLGKLDNIPIAQATFVRQIDSNSNFVWRGQKIDLANLATGGNGISTPGHVAAIDPRTGLESDILPVDRQAANTYVPIHWNPYLDGVFVPDGSQTQIVTSQGHTFEQCPPTNGLFYSDILVNKESASKKIAMVLQGIDYGVSDHPGIFLHANLGITFDLNRIRQLVMTDGNFVFRSKIGISERGTPRQCNADFWVLVDGQIRYQRCQVQTKGLCDIIEITLHPNDKFLTLMTTDGGDTESPEVKKSTTNIIRATESDWCIFAEPALIIK